MKMKKMNIFQTIFTRNNQIMWSSGNHKTISLEIIRICGEEEKSSDNISGNHQDM